MGTQSQVFYLLVNKPYQSEFLDSKLLDKTLDVSDECFHVVSIDPVWLPRLIVSSEGQKLEDENLETWRRLMDTSYRLPPPDVSSGNVESGASRQTFCKNFNPQMEEKK